MNPSLKLTYFDLAGFADPIRLAFAIGNVDFIDERVSREDFADMKPTLPYKQVPILSVDGQIIAQSNAILRYAGIVSGLYPTTNPLDGAFADEYLDQVKDIFFAIILALRATNEDVKREYTEKLLTTTLPDQLSNVEARLNRTNGAFALGKAITIADLALFNCFKFILNGQIKGVPADIFDKYANITALMEAVQQHPAVEKYFQDK